MRNVPDRVLATLAILTSIVTRRTDAYVAPFQFIHHLSESCDTAVQHGARLCAVIATAMDAEVTHTTDVVRSAETQLERSMLDTPKSADAWYWLGRIRVELLRDTLVSRGGALTPVGTSYATGAINAFVQTLRLRPDDLEALNALVAMPIPREGMHAFKAAVGVLRAARPVLSPPVMLRAAITERLTGSTTGETRLVGHTFRAPPSMRVETPCRAAAPGPEPQRTYRTERCHSLLPAFSPSLSSSLPSVTPISTRCPARSAA